MKRYLLFDIFSYKKLIFFFSSSLIFFVSLSVSLIALVDNKIGNFIYVHIENIDVHWDAQNRNTNWNRINWPNFSDGHKSHKKSIYTLTKTIKTKSDNEKYVRAVCCVIRPICFNSLAKSLKRNNVISFLLYNYEHKSCSTWPKLNWKTNFRTVIFHLFSF